MRTLAAGLFLVGILFSGCAGDPQVSTARPLLAAADSAAKTWQSDAVLIGIVGAEVGNVTRLLEAGPDNDSIRSNDEFRDAMDFSHDDSTVGDGRAASWLFRYLSASANASYDVIVAADGEVMRVRQVDSHDGTAVALDSWLLDSDAAWDAASKANRSAPAPRVGGNPVAASSLWSFGSGPHPVWFLFAEPGDESEGMMVVVDAQNGTVYDFADFIAVHMDLSGLLPVEMGEETGFVNVAQPSASETATLEGEHNELVFAVRGQGAATAPGQKVTVVVTAPDGRELRLNHTRATAAFDAPTHATLAGPPAGTYTASLELDAPPDGVLFQYEFSWCTDGLGVPSDPFGTAATACEFVES